MRIVVMIISIFIGILILIYFIIDDFMGAIIYFITEVKKDFITVAKVVRDSIKDEMNYDR